MKIYSSTADDQTDSGFYSTSAKATSTNIKAYSASGTKTAARWLVHPHHKVDIAVLPLPHVHDDPVFSLNAINNIPDPNLFVGVGMDCYILGYPFGPALPAFPVWKRGSIASEPDLAHITTNYILVDTASRPGMSGSPVIVRSWGFHLYDDGSSANDDRAESRFIGIYSGRVATRFRDEAQIGMVWGHYLIDEIIIGGHLDTD